jgi:uncharacterized ferritin-like protein (DUF455 family)
MTQTETKTQTQSEEIDILELIVTDEKGFVRAVGNRW